MRREGMARGRKDTEWRKERGRRMIIREIWKENDRRKK